jgi:hypothetical protein
VSKNQSSLLQDDADSPIKTLTVQQRIAKKLSKDITMTETRTETITE